MPKEEAVEDMPPQHSETARIAGEIEVGFICHEQP